MQSISRGAFFPSHQRHVRHRKARVMRRERHGLGAYTPNNAANAAQAIEKWDILTDIRGIPVVSRPGSFL